MKNRFVRFIKSEFISRVGISSIPRQPHNPSASIHAELGTSELSYEIASKYTIKFMSHLAFVLPDLKSKFVNFRLFFFNLYLYFAHLVNGIRDPQKNIILSWRANAY